jgi:N-methylhydantoinase B
VDLEGKARLLPYCEFDLAQNDVLYRRNSSGGGYGDPLERDPEWVLNDVITGIVSSKAARDIYGVVLEGEALRLDHAETQTLRAKLRRERLEGCSSGPGQTS